MVKSKVLVLWNFLLQTQYNIASKYETTSQQEPESFELEVLLIEGFKITGEK